MVSHDPPESPVTVSQNTGSSTGRGAIKSNRNNDLARCFYFIFHGNPIDDIQYAAQKSITAWFSKMGFVLQGQIYGESF
jgi:hypothetical protein